MSLEPVQGAGRGRVLTTWLLFLALALAAHQTCATEIPQPDLSNATPRVRDAVVLAREKVESKPGDGAVWGGYAMVLEAHRYLEPAASAYREAHRLSPEEFRWVYFLAALLDFRDPRDAVRWYEKAEALDDEYAPLHVRFAEALEKVGRNDDARAHYERAARLDPSNDLAHLGLGRLALAANEVDLALRHLERAYQLGPKQQAIVATLARARHRAGEREEATRLAQESRSLPRMMHHKDPRRASVNDLAVDRDAFLMRAKTALEVGQATRAASEMRRYLGLEPDDAEGWYLLASAVDRLGQPGEAEAAARRALELDPALVDARRLLAASLLRLGRLGEADREATAALAELPNDFSLLVVSTMAAAQSGDIPALMSRLDRAFAARTEDAATRAFLETLLVDLGDSLAAIGEFREAAKRIEQALEMAEETRAPAGRLSSLRAKRDAYRAGRLP